MSTKSESGKLACLDGLRGIAVLSVILYHIRSAGFLGFHPVVSASLSLAEFGYTGVHLFLVLSGFCLTLSWLRRSRKGRKPRYLDYLRSRWWRIAPPYYAAIAIYFAVTLVFRLIGPKRGWPEAFSLRQIAAHVTFLHGLGSDTIEAINIPFWSLSIEFQFYLLLPLLLLVALRVGFGVVLAAVLVASVAFRLSVGRYLPEEGHLINGLVLARLSEFAFGIAAAYWFESDRRKPLGTAAWIGLQTAGLVLLVGSAILARTGYHSASDYGFGLAYTAILITALVAAERGAAIGRVFEWRGLTWLGTISYSLYLTHNLFVDRGLMFYRRVFPRPTLLDALVIGCVLLAIAGFGQVYYLWIERRFIRSDQSPRAASALTRGVAAELAPASTT